jgi:hypothetical protein
MEEQKDEMWIRIPGTLIQDIQLEDGTDFIKQYGNYDKYEFEILLKKDEKENSNYW